MATSPLKWLFELTDKMSGPARAMGGSVKKSAEQISAMDKASQGLTKSVQRLEAQIAAFKANPAEFRKLQQLQKEMRGMRGGNRGSLFGLSLPDVASLAYLGGKVVDVFESIGSAAFDVGKQVVKAAADYERMNFSFEMFLGSKDKARAMSTEIEAIAKNSALTADQLKMVDLQLERAGYHGAALRNARAAAADIAALHPEAANPAQAAMDAADTLARLQERGRLANPKELKALSHETGLNELAIRAQIAKRFHVSAAFSDIEEKDQIAELIKKGLVTPEIMRDIIYKALIERGGGKGLGGIDVQASKLLSARLAKLENIPTRLFQKWAMSPAFTKFSDQIDGIVQKLDPESPSGKAIISSITRVSDMVVGAIDTMTEGNKVETLVKSFADLVPTFVNLATATGTLLADVARIAEKVAVFYGLTQEHLQPQSDWSKKVEDAARYEKTYDKARKALGITTVGGEVRGHSNVIRQAYNEGLLTEEDAAAGKIPGHIGGPTVPATMSPDTSALAKPVNVGGVTFSFEINGAYDPDVVAKAVKDQVAPHVINLLEGVATQQGAM